VRTAGRRVTKDKTNDTGCLNGCVSMIPRCEGFLYEAVTLNTPSDKQSHDVQAIFVT